MKGHCAAISTKLDASKSCYTWECLNKECVQFGKLLTDIDIVDEITYLIQQFNVLKKELEGLK